MDFQQIRKYVKGVLTNSFLNKTTLDKLSTSDEGNLLFNGEEIKGGSGDVDELLNKAAYLASEEEITELPTATESSYHNYSTEEKIIGTWVDGKPIYEKTLIFNNQYLASGFTDLAHGIDNIDIYIDLKGSYKNLDNSNSLLLSHLNTNGLNLSIGAWCENKTEIRISTGSSMAGNYNIYLTIQYIKITD